MDHSEKEMIVEKQSEALKYWVNTVLTEKGIKIENLAEEIKDGHTFPTLVQTLIGNEIKGISPHCKFTMQKLSNITLALEELRRVGIEDVSSAENFTHGLEKSVLATLFFMFEHFELSDVRGNAQKNLREICNNKIKNYGVSISSLRNITKNNAFFALIDSARKNGYPYQDKRIDDVKDVEHALDYTEKELGIPRIVDFVYLHRSHDITLLEMFLFFLCKLSGGAETQELKAEDQQTLSAIPDEIGVTGENFENSKSANSSNEQDNNEIRNFEENGENIEIGENIENDEKRENGEEITEDAPEEVTREEPEIREIKADMAENGDNHEEEKTAEQDCNEGEESAVETEAAVEDRENSAPKAAEKHVFKIVLSMSSQQQNSSEEREEGSCESKSESSSGQIDNKETENNTALKIKISAFGGPVKLNKAYAKTRDGRLLHFEVVSLDEEKQEEDDQDQHRVSLECKAVDESMTLADLKSLVLTGIEQ